MGEGSEGGREGVRTGGRSFMNNSNNNFKVLILSVEC